MEEILKRNFFHKLLLSSVSEGFFKGVIQKNL